MVFCFSANEDGGTTRFVTSARWYTLPEPDTFITRHHCAGYVLHIVFAQTFGSLIKTLNNVINWTLPYTVELVFYGHPWFQ